MKYCFIGGDSFEEDHLVWSPTTGQLVANHYNLVWKTFAKSGQGNFYIFNSLLQNIQNYDFKLALINWSSINRKDYITYHNNWQVTSAVKSLIIKDDHMALADQILYENLNYILGAQLILEGFNIPYCMWWGINGVENTKNTRCQEIIKVIKSKGSFYDFESSLFEKAKSNGQLLEHFDNHPNRDAHYSHSLEIIQFMKSQGITVSQ